MKHNNYSSSLSVVIPLYNKGQYIERALSSVLAQTHPPLEIIVVDDGSTDDGPEKVLKFNNPKIILIQQENKGPGAARNVGLVRSKGEYIAFIDADDEWLPEFLQKGLSFFENSLSPVSIVCLGYYYAPEMKRSILWDEDEKPSIFEINETTDVRSILRLISVYSASSTIVKTDIVKKWGGFYDRHHCCYGEDLYLFYKIMFNERIGIIPQPLAIYHTEASTLYAGGKMTNFPTHPYLDDSNDILLSCPSEKRHILQKLLFNRALIRAKKLASLGQKKKAKELFNRFYAADCLSFGDNLKIHLLISFAPLLPKMHICRRLLKALIGRNTLFC